jgi:multiple sugar transport system substrate-binding protein
MTHLSLRRRALAAFGVLAVLAGCSSAATQAPATPAGATATAAAAATSTAAAATPVAATPAPATPVPATPVAATPAVTPAGAAVTLEMWSRADLAAFLPAVIDAFNASHTNVQIKLTLIPDDQVTQKFAAAASGGAGPDIVSVDLARVSQYAAAGWFSDITANVATLTYKDKLSPSHLTLATVGDKTYALPFTADVSVLNYNKDLFTKAGLDPEKPPTTWAEISDAAKKIRALGDDTYGFYFSGACGGCMAFTFLPFTWANGGDVLSGTGTDVKPTIYPNEQLKAALQFFNTMWKDGVVHPQAQTDTGADQFGPFFSGKVGMYIQGTFPLPTLKKDHPEINWGATPIPGTTSGAAAFTGGDSVALTKQSEAHAAEAWEALAWLTDGGQKELAKAGVLPTRSDIAATDYAAADPRLAVFADALAVGHTPNVEQVAPLFYDPNGPWGAVVYDGIFNGNFDDAMKTGQKAMEDLLAQ